MNSDESDTSVANKPLVSVITRIKLLKFKIFLSVACALREWARSKKEATGERGLQSPLGVGAVYGPKLEQNRARVGDRKGRRTAGAERDQGMDERSDEWVMGVSEICVRPVGDRGFMDRQGSRNTRKSQS